MKHCARQLKKLIINATRLMAVLVPIAAQAAIGAEIMTPEEKSVALEEFTAVESHLSAEILVKRGDTWHLAIQGEARILPLIDVSIQAGTLKIGPRESFSTQYPLRLILTTPHIERAILGGSGELRLENLDQRDLELRIDGAGTIEAAGTVDRIRGAIGGSGELRLRGVSALTAHMAIGGSGIVEVTAHESLVATITGSGEIVYYGKPSRVSEEITGAGIVAEGQ